MDKQAEIREINRIKHVDPFSNHNGMYLTKYEPGLCVAELELTPNSLNPFGIVHGGAIFTLCDLVCGALAHSLGSIVVTLSSSVNFLREGTGKILRAEGRCVKSGKKVIVCRAEVFDDENRLVASGDFTLFCVPKVIPSHYQNPSQQEEKN